MTLPKGLYDLLISPEVDEQLQGLGVQYVINKREVKGLDRKRRLIADLSQRISDMLESLEGSSDYQQLELATTHPTQSIYCSHQVGSLSQLDLHSICSEFKHYQ